MKLYCSTGAFVGITNDRNYKLIPEAANLLKCQGFEFMIFDSWEKNLIEIATFLKESRINIPVVHTDKRMGAAISACTKESHQEAIDILVSNCKAASIVGAEYVLIHPWGYPDSDKYLDKIIAFMPKLIDLCHEHQLELLIEAVVAFHDSPLYNIKKLLDKVPEASLTIDTRHLAFHGQLEQLYNEEALFRNIKHVHVSDYRGEIKDWQRLRTVLPPGEGDIDFERFFDFLNAIEYNYGITLEAGNIKASGIDAESINQSLSYITQRIQNTTS